MKAKTAQATEKNNLSLGRRLLHIIGLPAWVYASFILAAIIIGFFAADITGSPLVDTVFAALVYTLTLVIAIGVPLRLFKAKTTKEELGLTRLPNWMDILLVPGSFIVYLIFAGLLMTAVTALFPGFDVEEVQEVGFDNLSHTYEYVLAFITLVIIAPVAEEVLVRGYLYGKLRKVASVAVAVIVSALLFSAMHMQWNVAVNVLPLGIIMVLMREMTGSVWSPIFLHMLKNGVAFYFLFIDPSIIDSLGV